MYKTLKEQVSELKAGDQIRAQFYELYDVWPFSKPTGNTYFISGMVCADSEELGDHSTLYIDKNGLCLRQGDGSPGGWLVSFEVIER